MDFDTLVASTDLMVLLPAMEHFVSYMRPTLALSIVKKAAIDLTKITEGHTDEERANSLLTIMAFASQSKMFLNFNYPLHRLILVRAFCTYYEHIFGELEIVTIASMDRNKAKVAWSVFSMALQIFNEFIYEQLKEQ